MKSNEIFEKYLQLEKHIFLKKTCPSCGEKLGFYMGHAVCRKHGCILGDVVMHKNNKVVSMILWHIAEFGFDKIITKSD